jgi:hypothetical protein
MTASDTLRHRSPEERLPKYEIIAANRSFVSVYELIALFSDINLDEVSL